MNGIVMLRIKRNRWITFDTFSGANSYFLNLFISQNFVCFKAITAMLRRPIASRFPFAE